MELILTQDVPALGAQGSVVTVKKGYARNYLIPQGLAKPATTVNKRMIEELKRLAAARAQEELQAAQAAAERLSSVSCTLSATVGEQEKLHGSITAAAIAAALKEHGVTVDKRQVELEAPLTKLGVYRVQVRLHRDVTATVKVWIVKA
ncbi:MAG: 50S ribosomal protein L9 [Candidatus Omnitrophica bacterium]|nr:50S ribosomal protein L9 [Candidatus Omnitrophota bacterium]